MSINTFFSRKIKKRFSRKISNEKTYLYHNMYYFSENTMFIYSKFMYSRRRISVPVSLWVKNTTRHVCNITPFQHFGRKSLLNINKYRYCTYARDCTYNVMYHKIVTETCTYMILKPKNLYFFRYIFTPCLHVGLKNEAWQIQCKYYMVIQYQNCVLSWSLWGFLCEGRKHKQMSRR